MIVNKLYIADVKFICYHFDNKLFGTLALVMSLYRCRPHILFTTHLTRYQINKTLTITIKIMIDIKSFLSHMTGKFIIAFFNIFANLAARSITFVGTRCRLQRIKLRSNQMTYRLEVHVYSHITDLKKFHHINIVLIFGVLLNALSFYLK